MKFLLAAYLSISLFSLSAHADEDTPSDDFSPHAATVTFQDFDSGDKDASRQKTKDDPSEESSAPDIGNSFQKSGVPKNTVGRFVTDQLKSR